MGWPESYIRIMHWPVPLFQSAVATALIAVLGMGPDAVQAQARQAPLPVPVQDQTGPDAPIPGQDETPAPDSPAPDPGDPEADPEAGPAPNDQGMLAEPAAPDEPTEQARLREREDLDMLFQELAQPEGETWARAETDILRIWSRSGSASMDLLAKRGEAAIDAGDLPGAIGHLTALTDHAPEFANGWYLRGVAFYLQGNPGLAIADMAQVLALEPRQFGALTQLGTMFEELGEDDRALEAYRASLKIHPHQQDAADAVTRLEEKNKGTDA